MNFGCKPFYDLCINYECFERNHNETMELLLEYGYNTIAVNRTVNIDEVADEHKKKKKGEQKRIDDIIPFPKQIVQDEKYSGLKILSRLTVIFAEKNIQNMIKSSNYNKYDIVALAPLSQGAFQLVLGAIEADILSFGYVNKINFQLNRKHCNKLLSKGIYFELSYNPLIVDQTQRRNCIFLSHILHTYVKSRNIIVTSGATKPIHIRSPYDAINLGFILGLSEQQSKDALSYCQEQVVLNSVGRRHGKTIAYVGNNITNEIIVSDSDDTMENKPTLKKLKKI